MTQSSGIPTAPHRPARKTYPLQWWLLILCFSLLIYSTFALVRSTFAHAGEDYFHQPVYGFSLWVPTGWETKTILTVDTQGDDGWFYAYGIPGTEMGYIPNVAQYGSMFAIKRDAEKTTDTLPPEVSGNEDILYYVLHQYVKNAIPLGKIRHFRIGWFPAFSGSFFYRNNSSDERVMYLTIVLRHNEIIELAGFCYADDYLEYKPDFDRMLDSFKLENIRGENR